MKLQLSRQKVNKSLPYVILGSILVLAAYLRFVGLTRVGMIGSDTFQYWQIAKWWTEGNYTLDGFYRPFIYLLYSLWMKIFGEYDYTLSVFNTGMDLLNIFLIYIITKKISSKNYVALGAAAVYAFLPGIIHFARISLVHIPSATFVLLSLWWFLKFQDSKTPLNKIFYLFLVGLTNSLAAHIHPDLAFLAPVYLLFIIFHFWNNGSGFRKFFIIKNLLSLGMFFIGFLSVYLVGIMYYGLFMFFNTLLRERSDGAASITTLQLWWQIIYTALKTHTYAAVPYLFFGSILIAFYQRLGKIKTRLEEYLPPSLVLGYSIVSSMLLTRYIERLFVPLIPLAVISICIWYAKIFSGRKSHLNMIIVLSIAFIISYINFLSFYPILKKYQSGYKTIYREAYDILKNQVGEDNKILITPYIFYSHRKGFAAPFYFSENAKYIIDYHYTGKPLSELIKNEKIKFLYVGKLDLDYRILKQPPTEIPLDYYGLRLNNWESGYSLEKELMILDKFVKKVEAEKIFESENGIIYKFI